ncbi:hypothetical protein Sdia_48140 [Streptomyces diastaticus subsp. diastaticus]|uniref:PE-PGRS family protein n=1 Tax=Streptomyces diastaticus subsp. diastaticus TaxID=68040 RepID=A0ABQ1CUS4_STRDI|nr:hypothetical protein Sdia_48140 [Streptomyces diastaticus subsp. diastaticus]GGU49997.1 hypothetical protein GCM10015534_59410 [Streptomyces diastaticus subsp. diastaticus]
MKYTLTEPQVDLLREIAAASSAMPIPPARTQTSWALEQRDLVKRTWRGSGHVAVVTADGRYYLKHGKHPREVQAEKERLKGDAAQAALAPTTGTELIFRLQSASGKITVPDPAAQTRGRWRAAYYDALHHGHVPTGHKLRWNGRERGDCVFTLIDEEAEKAAQPLPVPAVDVPEILDRPHRLVRVTRKALGRSQRVTDTRGKPAVIPLYLSRPLADRALRIMHALFTEAERRGYTVEAQSDLQRGEAVHTVAIMIQCRAFPLALTERTTKVPHEPTPQERRQQERNPWTRLPKYDEEFNGRLALGAPSGSWYQHSYCYSDSARWTLESRLGHLLQNLERLAAEADRREREKELREAEQRRRWYAAVARAREQQIEQHRAMILTGQIRDWRQAEEIRAFCQAARARAGEAPVATEEADWLEWAEAYAVQLDPLREPLRTPVDPPAGREALRELAKIDAYAYAWPFDADGRWTLPGDCPTDPRT